MRTGQNDVALRAQNDSVCSPQCNDAANRLLMESHAEDGFLVTIPIGLDLQITPSLEVNKLHKPSNSGMSSPLKYSDLVDYEKLRASNIKASTIQIGSWQKISKREDDLVIKIYFAKRRVVWEILQENRRKKNKIEIRWNDIIGLRATMEADKPGVLQVELASPPSFEEEIEPVPRKHTMWLSTSDFTGGQASICRRHLVTFPPGALDMHIHKLFVAEPRMLELSRKRFPTMQSPHFQRRQTAFPCVNFNGAFQPFGLPYIPVLNNFPMARAVHPSLRKRPSPMPDQHVLQDRRVYMNPPFVQWSGNAYSLPDGQVHGIASNVAPSTFVSPALYHPPLGEQGLEAQRGNDEPRQIRATNNQLQSQTENVSWTVKQSRGSVDTWNAMLNGSRDGTHGNMNTPPYEYNSSSTVDNNVAGGNENVPVTPDSQFYQTSSAMPPSLSHLPGITNPPQCEHDSSSTTEDYATINENVPFIPESQFYQTASAMPTSLSHLRGITNTPQYEHDGNCTIEDYATINENVPVMPDSQF